MALASLLTRLAALSWCGLAACSSAAPSRVVDRTVTAPPPDAAIDAAVAAAMAAAAPSPDAPVVLPDAPPPHVDFVAPPPLILEPATPASSRCVADVRARERDRVVAALDAALRKANGFVLPVQVGAAMPDQDDSAPLGSTARDASGQLWMIVGGAQCGYPPPTFAIDAQGAVFLPVPVVKGRSHRKISACDPECYGCGMQMPPTALVARVPDHAYWDGTERKIVVPMAVEVTVTPSKRACIPRP